MLISTGASAFSENPSQSWLVVSIPDQELVLIEQGVPVRRYPVSTSRFGHGDRQGSYRTPLGVLEVAQKIGSGAPLGAVLKHRRFTGEVLRPNAFGRDPIVSRILWLRGLQATNRNAYERGIYIHGTPVERLIGRPVSYGCIRMRSRDVIDLFGRVDVGVRVKITTRSTYHAVRQIAGEVEEGRASI
jgi:lipoprotein-anchoring transpeptidase ErfK/SrfK